MGSDVRLDSLSTWERGTAPLSVAADAAPERASRSMLAGAGDWPDALPLLLTLLLVLLSPLLYDLGRWLRAG